MSEIETNKDLLGAELDRETKKKIEEHLKQSPQFSSAEEALAAVTGELESLAQKYSVSVPELIKKADEAVEHNDDFLQALALNSQILGLRKSIRSASGQP